MRIIQVLTTMAFGDAVGNDTMALHEIIKKAGYETGIYAENIDSRLPKGIVQYVKKIPKLNRADIIIYHLSTGTPLNQEIKKYTCRKVLIYHNITPPFFFEKYSPGAFQLCKIGLEQTQNLSDCFDYVFADSEFNAENLREMGYKCPIEVLPILIAFEDYKKRPNDKVIEKYKDGCTNILFVGRIVPNKKQEDIIRTFYYYQKFYNPKSRLFLIGSYQGMEPYYNRLMTYIERLGVKNIIIPGHSKFDEILAYYHVADTFICLSEHEGFCVPLVEAMYFGVPIIAFDACAIRGTLGGSGLLLKNKNAIEIAGLMDKLDKDTALKCKVIRNEKERLQEFDHEKIERMFWSYMSELENERGN